MNTRMNRILAEMRQQLEQDEIPPGAPEMEPDDDDDDLGEAGPTEPTARARFRMDTAARKAGIDGMLKATELRVSKTTDSYKLQGIAAAAEILCQKLMKIKKMAQAKA